MMTAADGDEAAVNQTAFIENNDNQPEAVVDDQNNNLCGGAGSSMNSTGSLKQAVVDNVDFADPPNNTNIDH